jgi:hypothetical protein
MPTDVYYQKARLRLVVELLQVQLSDLMCQPFSGHRLSLVCKARS